jgi:hypothetical protein
VDGRARQKHALHCKYLPKQGFGQRLSGHVQGGQRLMNIHTRDDVSHCYTEWTTEEGCTTAPASVLSGHRIRGSPSPERGRREAAQVMKRAIMKVYAVTRARIRHVILISSDSPTRQYIEPRIFETLNNVAICYYDDKGSPVTFPSPAQLRRDKIFSYAKSTVRVHLSLGSIVATLSPCMC